MVRRLSIALIVMLAVFTAAVRLPVQACALDMPAAQKAPCTDDCCATMKSCVLSQHDQTPAVASTDAQPSVSFIAQPIQSLLVQTTVNLPTPDLSRAGILPDSPPRLAVLCTFLIWSTDVDARGVPIQRHACVL